MFIASSQLLECSSCILETAGQDLQQMGRVQTFFGPQLSARSQGSPELLWLHR